MAELIVLNVLESVARLLDQDKECLLRRVEHQVEALQKELVIINSFLKNAEAKRTENDEVQEVLDRIRDGAGEAEDVVDTYRAEIIELRRRRPLLRKLYHSSFSHGRRLRAAAKKIYSVRNTIHLIYSKADRYGILQEGYIESSSTAGRAPTVTDAEAAGPSKIVKEDYMRETVEIDVAKSSDHGKASSPEHKGSSSQQEDSPSNSHSHSQRWHRSEFDYVVGFEHETSTLISHLVEGDPTLDVISITGMDGLGKTTLASKIYKDRRVRDHFDCQAWVFLSQEHKTKDYLFVILRCLISSSLPEEMYTVSEQELKLTLRAFLREKRYLIVFDDLWTTRVWDEVRDAFPNSFNGSRLLITSDKQVALLARQTPPYSLKSLDEETSWRLFCKKVPIIDSNPDLEAPGKQLVKSCMGAPLAILVLGGLLVQKEEKYETWSKLIDYVSFNYSQNTRSLDILRLSYSHLPQNLKPCFLQLSVFPMDFEISARYLIKLWFAEGAIQETETKTVEDVADDYLEELSARSLIQVTKRRSDGGAKACRIHHLLREISLSEALKEKFLEVHSESNPASIRKARRVSRVTNRRRGDAVHVMARRIHDLLIRELPIVDIVMERFLEVLSETNYASTSKTRRLSIQGNISEYISSYPHVASRVHSLFLFGEGDDFDIKHWRWIFKNFKFLRVLCLEKLFLDSIPKHIEKLIFLRYLRIRSEKLIELVAIPASICNLQYLEEIDVDGRVEECLPKEIWNMRQLRNLRFSGGISILATPTPTDNISIKLQVLSYVLVDENTKFLMSNLRFPYLRKLNLKYDDGLTKMNKFEVADVLESLCPEENEEELRSLKKLESLKILDFPTSEPRPNLFPSTLVKITFMRSYFNSIHIENLAKLPNLQILKLKGRFPYYGILGPLRCVADDFRQLRVLQMIDLELEIWILENGAMKKLEHLVISECYQLRNVPEELAKLSALRLVEVSRASQSFKGMLKKLDFGDKCKVLIDSKPLKPDTENLESLQPTLSSRTESELPSMSHLQRKNEDLLMKAHGQWIDDTKAGDRRTQ